jgi:hypothetical protein
MMAAVMMAAVMMAAVMMAAVIKTMASLQARTSQAQMGNL